MTALIILALNVASSIAIILWFEPPLFPDRVPIRYRLLHLWIAPTMLALTALDGRKEAAALWRDLVRVVVKGRG